MSMDEVLTPGELAALWKVDTSTIYTWHHLKRLPIPPLKVGRCLRFRRTDALQYIRTGKPVTQEAAP